MAVANASSDWLFLCDADMLVNRDLLSRGLESLSQHKAFFPICRCINENGSLRDLDPNGFKLVMEFKNLMLSQYQDWITAWVVGLNPEGNNRVDRMEFVYTLQKRFPDVHGNGAGSAEKEKDTKDLGKNKKASSLFRLLQSTTNKSYLNLSDIDAKAGNLLVNGLVPNDLERLRTKAKQEAKKTVLINLVACILLVAVVHLIST